MLYQHITACLFAIKFNCLIPGNVSVLDEDMVKLMYTLVLIEDHVERILAKNKLLIPNCQPLLLGENYTEIKT